MDGKSRRLALVGDVGGTNTRCALAEGPRVRPETVRRYHNHEFAARGEGLGAVLSTYLREIRAETGALDCTAAAVAIAGPVREGAGRLTNIDWAMDRAELARIAGAARVEVLNDLQAQGHALDALAPGALRQVVAGRPLPPEAQARATRLVIGAGTGFNAAPVLETPAGRVVPPSEAGHASLPARGERVLRLARFIEHEVAGTQGFASIEDVLSGRGLEAVYRWLGAEAGAANSCSAAQIMAALGAGGDPRAEETARIYVQILGNVTGNLALTLLPYGGIYLIGGVVRAIQPWLGRFGFAEALCDKGRLAGFMAQFPVFVVEDDFAALTGCATFLHGQG